jgi:hypothetical protein
MQCALIANYWAGSATLALCRAMVLPGDVELYVFLAATLPTKTKAHARSSFCDPRPQDPAALPRGMVAKSADALVDLYAADAVHEFPFPLSGTPERYSGREQLRAGYREAWSRTLLRIDSIENFTVHETLD